MIICWVHWVSMLLKLISLFLFAFLMWLPEKFKLHVWLGCFHFYVPLQRGAQATWEGAQEDTQLWGLEVLAQGICRVCGRWNYQVEAGKYECAVQKTGLS